MHTKTNQCVHCRQRLSTKANEPEGTKTRCPGCKLLVSSSSSWHQQKSSDQDNQRGSLYHVLMKKIRNKDTSSPQSLNIRPSSLLTSSYNRPSKRAVICGVSYSKGKFKLKGTINDVRTVKDLLINSFQFLPEGIVVLTEEEKDEMFTPTRKSIRNALEWLVKDCRQGDSLVFYFSGHGLRQPDFNDDEIDGFDETICPVDFLREGMMVDNEINSLIVKPLKKGVTLHAIVDSCHSGTILDLEYVYNKDSKLWEDNKPPSGASKATDGGLAICLSACQDNQLASDSSAFTGNTMNGVMTYILAQILTQHPRLLYSELLDQIHMRIEDVKKTDCLINTKLLRRFFKDKLSQKPMLSSSEMIEVDKRYFVL